MIGATVDFTVLRLNTDGSLDTSFDTDGIATIAVGASSDTSKGVAIQPNGRIIVVGESYNGTNSDFALVRLNANGSLDTSFDTDGRVTAAVGTSADSAAGIALQSDGKLVVAGYATFANGDTTVVRYNTNGSVDTSFGATSTLNGAPTFIENGAAVVLDSDVTIFDSELSANNNFNGATLTLARSGGANAEDIYSATGTLSALTESGNLVVGGTVVGTVVNNSSGTLVLIFNSSATNALVNSVMQQIAFSNTSDTPPASAQINWTFSDGNTGAQGTGGDLTVTGSVTVNITATNDAPTLTSISSPLGTIAEDTQATITFADLQSSGNEADVDGTVIEFVVKGVSSGTLRIGTSAGTATAWVAGVNDTIDATRQAYWTGPMDAYGTLNAFTVVAKDNGGLESPTPVQVQLSVTAVNDAPVEASLEGTALSYNENAGAVTITSAITVVDVDDTNIESAIVAITVNYVSGQDTLAFTNQNGISGSWNSMNGTLSLSGTATLAQYEAALRSVVYANSSDSPSTATRTVSFTVNDGDSDSSSQSRDIAITPVNDAPVVVNKVAQMLAGLTINVSAANGLLADAWDIEGDPLTAVLIAGPNSGNLTINSDGSWSYIAATGYYGDVTFIYAANDGSANSSTATVTIQISAGGVVPPSPSNPTPDTDSKPKLVPVRSIALSEPEFTAGKLTDSGNPGSAEVGRYMRPRALDQLNAIAAEDDAEVDELLPDSAQLKNIRFRPYSQKHLNLAEYADESARMNFMVDNADLQLSLRQFRSLEDERLATLNLVSGVATTLFVGATAGVAAWSVGGSYLLSIIASSLPTWSSFDVIHVVNNPTRIKESDDKSIAQIIVAALPSVSK
jgi:uncharacterized delta-60 repeat protein